jgi:glycogen operon protein
MAELFRSNPVLRRRDFFTGRPMTAEGWRDVTWIRPDGQEMTEADWRDHENRVLGMLILGRATDDVDERGRATFGDTLFFLLNGGARSRLYTLPRFERPGIWEELLNTARPGRREVKLPTVNLTAHSTILLRQRRVGG